MPSLQFVAKFIVLCALVLLPLAASGSEAGAASLPGISILPAINESEAKEFDNLLIIEGISNLVGQEFYDSGLFTPIEDKREVIDKIASGRTAVGQAVAEARVVIKKIRKSRLRGFAGWLSGAKTTVKIVVEVSLREQGNDFIRAVGKAKAVTKSLGAVFQVREDKVYFDQTATGQMVQRAVHEAVTKLIKKRME